MNDLKVIGHRGARGLFTENSLASFRAAANSRADAIEFDVQTTKDGRLVVCHTMSSPKKVFGITQPINQLSWQQLKTYKSKTGERMPTFEEVMEVLKDKPVAIDVKDEASAKLLVKALKQRGIKNVRLINSLYPSALAEIKGSFPGLDMSLHTYKHPFRTIRAAKELGLSHVSLVLYLLNPVTYWRARRAGLKIATYQNYASSLLTWPWLVHLLWLIYPGVIIISDRPDKITGKS